MNRDTFSDQNMKSRDHILQLKEKLALMHLRVLQMENKDIFPTPVQGKNKKKGKEEALKVEKNQSYTSADREKKNTSQERSIENTPKERHNPKFGAEEADRQVVKNEI